VADIDDLISKEALDAFSKFQTDLGKVVTMFDTVIKQAKTFDQAVSYINKATTSQDQLNKKVVEATDIQKKYQLAQDADVKAKLEFQKAVKDQKQAIQAIIDAEDKEIGTLDALTKANKRLRQERNDLDLTTKQGVQRLKDINKEIDNNTKFITKNVDSLSKQKIGIGAYADGIKSAALNLVSFGGIVGTAMAAVYKLYDAFLQTEAGAKFQGEIKQISKTFLQNLIPSIKQYWQAYFSGDAEKAKEVQKDVLKNVADSVSASDALNKLRIEERNINEQNAKDETQIKINRLEAIKAEGDSAKQLKLLNEAEKLEDDIITRKKDHLTAEIAQYKILSKARQDNTELLDILSQKQIELTNLEGDKSLRLAAKQIKAEKEEQIKLTDEQIAKTRALTIAMEEQMHLSMQERFKNPAFQLGDSSASIIKDSKISKKQHEITSGIENDIDKANERILKAQEKADARILKEKEQKANLEKELIQGVFSFEEQLIERKISKLETQKNIELSAANLTAAQKTAINDKYAKKEAELKRKEAIAQKAASLFSIALDTAKGVMKATAELMLPLIPFIIAAGAVQAATVMAKPLPQFAKGIDSAPGGPAIVGEKGKELIVTPSGQVILSPENPAIMNIEKGSKIFPSDETKKILSYSLISKQNTIEATIKEGNKELIRTIKNKREIILGTSTGHYITERTGETYKQYFKRHLQ
jgi:hypothetical protein